MPYYMIRRNCDGETRVGEVEPSEVAKDLDEGSYDADDFLAELPERSDTNEWPGETAILLIKGVIVTPTAKEVATKWEIE